MTDELVEKCLLTNEEWRKAWSEGRYYGAGDIGSTQNILKSQLTKAIPIIRQEVAKEIGELIDEYIGHGEYSVEIEGGKCRCVSADLEQVWGNIKAELKAPLWTGGESAMTEQEEAMKKYEESRIADAKEAGLAFAELERAMCNSQEQTDKDKRELVDAILNHDSLMCADPTAIGLDDCGYEAGSPQCHDCQLDQILSLFSIPELKGESEDAAADRTIDRLIHDNPGPSL